MRSVRRGFLAAAAAVLAASMVGLPTDATAWDGHVLVDRFDVAPGLAREVYREHTDGNGTSNVQVLRFSLTDGRVSVRPELARGQVAGHETVSATTRRLGEDAVAAVNANFFNPACPPTDPTGDPCGLIVRDGLVVSENVRNGGQWPGAFALFPPNDGIHARPWSVDNAQYNATVRVYETNDTLTIDGINRVGATGELIAYTAAYGASTQTPAGTVEYALPQVPLRARTSGEYVLSAMSTSGNSAIPSTGIVLAATGAKADALRGRGGERIEVFSYVAGPNWNGATQAIGAGPTILKDGQVTSSSQWFSEGFADAHNQPHPRTIVGFTPGGEMLLVTVDGRGAGGSAGMATIQAAHLMQHLGAVDAVMMDGGGSTTMAVDGRVVNAPSGGAERAVASSLVVTSHVDTPDITRLAGIDRFATAAAIADAGWPSGATRVVVANGARFPDALAGGPFAGDRDAPLLLVETDRIHPATAAALERLDPQEIVILGGTGVVDEGVEAQLRRYAPTVARLGGADRTETAANIARHVGAPGRRAFLASADTFPDALTAAVPASRSDSPLLLTWKDQLAGPTAAALSDLGVRDVLVAGGRAAVSDAVLDELRGRGLTVTRIAGEDRFETAARLTDWAIANTGLSTADLVLANGGNFPDALSGGPYAARTGAALLLTHPADIDRSKHTRAWLDRHDVDAGWLMGGRGALASWIAHELQAAIAAS